MSDRQKATIYSALWGAWGDALGFITELADENGVRWRTGSTSVSSTVAWRRRVGGKYGAVVRLPAGCYSDDTQLRLATSRSIRRDGTFDVDAFSKVEVAVFASYALGAGRGTKAAAESLAKATTRWSSNFFGDHGQTYVNGGGNGAAMRVQPHVWSAASLDDAPSILGPVLRNTVSTHGHARALVGAAFHALLLADALRTDAVPSQSSWEAACTNLDLIAEVIQKDPALSTLWLPTWERCTGRSFRSALSEACAEVRQLIKEASEVLQLPRESAYVQLVSRIGLAEADQRGSATKTAVAAGALAALFEGDPEKALLLAANTLGTDTDSIATMAGALLGCAADTEPPGDILDRDYIVSEATRMHQIAAREPGISEFQYPDLLGWSLPRAVIDYVGKRGPSLYMAGLGPVESLSEPIAGSGRPPSVWEWMQLVELGQSCLVRRREKPLALPKYLAVERPRRAASAAGQDRLFESSQRDEPGVGSAHDETERSPQRDRPVAEPTSQDQSLVDAGTLAAAIRAVRRSQYDPQRIGQLLLDFARRRDDLGYEYAIALAALVIREARSDARPLESDPHHKRGAT